MTQKPPQRIEAPNKDADKPATIIFLHGLGDDADGWTNIASQFHSASKLPHLTWIFPNAPHNHEAMTTAWYTPRSFTPIPVGRRSGQGDEEDDEEADEGEEEILKSVEYVCGLIDEEVKRGVDVKRIVIGGFSQGCALGLVLGLGSRYSGRIGGVIGLSGYLPKGPKIKREQQGFLGIENPSTKNKMKIFLAHGTKDMLVPMRVFRDTRKIVEKVVGSEDLESHEYTGMGHVTSGEELKDICEFLERVVPE